MLDIESLLKTMQKQYTEDKTKHDLLQKEKTEIIQKLADSDFLQKNLELESEIISKAAKNARKEAGTLLETMASHALQFIFEENKAVEIQFNERDECYIYIVKEVVLEDGSIEKAYMDPNGADGGGLADAVSFSLLIAMNSFTEPKNEFALVFDEPSKYISKGLELGNPKRVAQFFKDISLDLNKQIILVSHNDSLIGAADKAFKVSLDIDKNISHVEEIVIKNIEEEFTELVNNL